MGTLGKFWIVVASLWLTTNAWATPMTITFDMGGFDPNPAPCDYHGPYDFVEEGSRTLGFWLQDYNMPSAEVRCGHTHVNAINFPGATGQAVFDHPWENAVQGIHITLDSGQAFDLISIDSRVRYRWADEEGEGSFVRQDWSFPEDEVHMLISASFDPNTAVHESLAQIETYFTSYSIDDGSVHSVMGELRPYRPANSSPMITTMITGFEGITDLWITSTGSTAFDNIVITPLPVPEPGTAALLGMGFLILSTRRRIQGPWVRQ